MISMLLHLSSAAGKEALDLTMMSPTRSIIALKDSPPSLSTRYGRYRLSFHVSLRRDSP